MRRLALLLVLAACQGWLDPGDVLTGYFSSSDVQMIASAHGLIFNARCEHAEFGPVSFGPNPDFEAESTVFTMSGLVIHSPTDRMRLSGRLAGDQLILQIYIVRTEPPAVDPIVVTLWAGGSWETLVCNV